MPNPGSPYDQNELPVALTCSVPAAQQHRHFFVTADQRRKMPPPGATPAAARANDPVEGYRRRHALERMAAAFFGDEQAGDLALHPRGDQHRARLGDGLHPRRYVRHLAKYPARRIDHHRPGIEADARLELRLAGRGVPAVELRERALDRERGTHSAFGIVLLPDRIAEQGQQPVAKLPRHTAAHLRDRRRGGLDIAADHIAPILGIELRRNCGGADQIAEQNSDVATLPSSFLRRRGGRQRRRRSVRSCRRGPRIIVRCVRIDRGGGLEQFETRTEREAELAEMIVREIGQNGEVYVILAERRLILFEADTPQQTPEIHRDTLLVSTGCANHRPIETCCPGRRLDRAHPAATNL